MQERCELDRLRMQQQEMLIQQQLEQEQQGPSPRISRTEQERSLSISTSKRRPQGVSSAKWAGERSMELESAPWKSSPDLRRSQVGEGAREQQPQQMSPRHASFRRPQEGGQVGNHSTPPGAQEQGLTSKANWAHRPDDPIYDDIKLPSCLSGVSAISRTEHSIKRNNRSILQFKSSKGSRFSERWGAAEADDSSPKSPKSPKSIKSSDSTTQQRKTRGESGSDQCSDSAPVSPTNREFAGAEMEGSGGGVLFEKEDDTPPAIAMPWPARRPPSPEERDTLPPPAHSEHTSLHHSASKVRGVAKGRRPASSPERGCSDSPSALAHGPGWDTPAAPLEASGHEGDVGRGDSAGGVQSGTSEAGSRHSSSAGVPASTGVEPKEDLSAGGGEPPQQVHRGRVHRALLPRRAFSLPDVARPVGRRDVEQPLQQQQTRESLRQQRSSLAAGPDTEDSRVFMSQLSNKGSGGSGTDDQERRAAAEEEGCDQTKKAFKRASKALDGSAGDYVLAGTKAIQIDARTSREAREPQGAAGRKPSSPSGVAKANAWTNHEDNSGRT
ncbi:hypothetical protein DUNSADRAFT_17729 [Dunaliella salina]|uniref:Uncharacterized protein n=1 Tax=Dunaliella salina TaxID=3046 RepID=A0ABQ7GZU0_DUNSA|nr:hypothetical protein DUNSADRAFT_17729 [Dunaliella salina]|eukprot:KAF5840128.1 hypothetical protein DUNSADRAFT_17729 [Dunaliella salina]